jgi:lipopolysaccharide export system permease protein
MGVITRSILKEHIGPFVFSMGILIFVFILNILYKDLGRLLGKGLPIHVILEFFLYNMAWVLALAIPMAVLVSTLMAFGRMSSDHEITALKACGVSFARMITPVLLISVLLAGLMIVFNDIALPEFNHRLRLLYSDISRKRPTFSLEPHVFFNDIPGYGLWVDELDEKKNSIQNVILNDSSDPKITRTIIAKDGRIEFSLEQEKLLLTLFHGEIHEIKPETLLSYRRLKFNRQVFAIPLPDMILKRSDSEIRGDREKTNAMMRDDIKKDREAIVQRESRIREWIVKDLHSIFPPDLSTGNTGSTADGFVFNTGHWDARLAVQQMIQKIQSDQTIVTAHERTISSLMVEIHKKYAIPVACIVFVLIGSPLGVQMRLGGFAVAGGVSILFFLIFWSFLIGGEQLADRQLISPFVAMWSADALIGLAGLWMSMHVARETEMIPESLKRIIAQIGKGFHR